MTIPPPFKYRYFPESPTPHRYTTQNEKGETFAVQGEDKKETLLAMIHAVHEQMRQASDEQFRERRQALREELIQDLILGLSDTRVIEDFFFINEYNKCMVSLGSNSPDIGNFLEEAVNRIKQRHNNIGIQNGYVRWDITDDSFVVADHYTRTKITIAPDETVIGIETIDP